MAIKVYFFESAAGVSMTAARSVIQPSSASPDKQGNKPSSDTALPGP